MNVKQGVINSVNVRFLKKGRTDVSSPRPAKIIVTDTGKIDIICLEGKFPPIHLKAANFVTPRRPRGKTTWIFLDIIQNVEAKFAFVNFQVNTPSEVEDLYNTLMIAWTRKTSDYFNCENSFVARAPIHVPPPIKKLNAIESTAEGGRSDRANITVDPERSSFLGFNTDFSNSSSMLNRTQVTRLFDSYGLGNTNNTQPLGQVHANPAPRLFVPEKNQEREKVLELTAVLEKVHTQAEFWGEQGVKNAAEIGKLKSQLNEERQKSAEMKHDIEMIKDLLIREEIDLDDEYEPTMRRPARREPARHSGRDLTGRFAKRSVLDANDEEPPVKKTAVEPVTSPEVAELRQQLNQAEENFQKLCDVARRDKEALQARVDYLETLIDSKEGILKNANKGSAEVQLPMRKD